MIAASVFVPMLEYSGFDFGKILPSRVNGVKRGFEHQGRHCFVRDQTVQQGGVIIIAVNVCHKLVASFLYQFDEGLFGFHGFRPWS